MDMDNKRSRPAESAQERDDDTSNATLRRRGLVAGALAAAAAIALDRGDPAVAADPNDVVLGAANTTNKTTTITNTEPTSATALVLNCTQSRNGVGLEASGTTSGVRGIGSPGGSVAAVGVTGDSQDFGVSGISRSNTGSGSGVTGSSSSPNGTGVRGQCPGVGVHGSTASFDPKAPSGPIGVFGASSFPNGLGGVFTGVCAPLRLLPSKTSGSPTGGLHDIGEIMVDDTGRIFACTAAGTPGTWTELGATPPPAPAPPAPQPALTLLPTPERFVDTRIALGGVQGPVPGSTTHTYTMTGRLGQSGNPALQIPDNATALVGNLTVVGAANVALGAFVTLWPSGTQPTVSNINFGPSNVTGAIANSFVVGLADTTGGGRRGLRVFNQAACDYILDVTGYYTIG